MQDLVRGWQIVMSHGHVDIAIWIAILVPAMTGAWIAIWVGRQKPNEEDTDMRPKRRAPLPRSNRGFL